MNTDLLNSIPTFEILFEGKLNNHPTVFNFDSGSSLTVIPIQLLPLIEKNKLKPCSTKATSFCKNTIEFIAEANVQISIGERTFTTKVLISPNHHEHILLGTDSMLKMSNFDEIKIDILNSKLNFGKFSTDLILPAELNYIKPPYLRVSNNQVIPARSIVTIICYSDKQLPFDHVTEKISTLSDKYGLLSSDGLYSRNTVEYYYIVLNISNKPITLYKGTRIATIHKAVEEDQLPILNSINSIIQNDEPIIDGQAIVNNLKTNDPVEIAKALQLDLSSKHINEEQRRQLAEICIKYPNLWSQGSYDLGLVKTDFEIKVTDDIPVRTKTYPIPPHLQPIARQQINDLLRARVITHSTSPYSCSALLPPKKTVMSNAQIEKSEAGEIITNHEIQSRRLVCDFRKINLKLVKNYTYPLPPIQNSINKLQGAKYFSSCDAKSGFYQIEIRPQDRKYFAFSVDGIGHFEYTVLPQGISISTNIFQRVMDVILTGLDPLCMELFVDDIVIHSPDFDSHMVALEALFKRLHEHNLKLSPHKAHLAMNSCLWLGHIISNNEVKPDPTKTLCVKNYPEPKSLKQVRQFIGACSFYRRFVPNYATLSRPLYMLTRKCETEKGKFTLSHEAKEAFIKMRDYLSSPNVLVLPDLNKTFYIYCDASLLCGSGILLQKHDNVLRVVSYASKAFDRQKQASKCSLWLEGACLVYLIKHEWHSYLIGSPQPFHVFTDCRDLVKIFSVKPDSSRLSMFAMALSDFNFKIHYVKGGTSYNKVVDALSRANCLDLEVLEIDSPILYEHLIMPFDPEGQKSALDNKKPHAFNSANINQLQINNDNNQIPLETYFDDPMYIRTCQEKDMLCNEIINQLKSDSPNNDKYYLDLDDCIRVKRQRKCVNSLLEDPFLIPDELKNYVLEFSHSSLYGGHAGYIRCLEFINRQFYWTSMSSDLKHFISACPKCNAKKNPPKNFRTNLHPTPICEIGYIVQIDVSGKLPMTIKGNVYFLTITEISSRFTVCYPMPNQTSDTIARILAYEYLPYHTMPAIIHTDGGQNLINSAVKKVCSLLGIEQKISVPYHSASLSINERTHSTINQSLATLIKDQENWDNLLPYAVQALNNFVNTSIGFSPYFLYHGRTQNLPIHRLLFIGKHKVYSNYDELVSELEKHLSIAYDDSFKSELESQTKQKYYYERSASPRVFKVGDIVRLFRPPRKGESIKLFSPWTGPFIVIDIHYDCVLTIKSINEPNKEPKKVHMDQVKICNHEKEKIPENSIKRLLPKNFKVSKPTHSYNLRKRAKSASADLRDTVNT